MSAVASLHSPIFAERKPKKLKASFWLALSVASIIHLAGGYYLVSQKFRAPPAQEEGPVTTVDYFPPPKKPEQPKPVKPAPPPPPTTLTPREVKTPIPDDVDTTPLKPAAKPADDASKTPPIIRDGPPTIGPGTKPVEPAYVTARWTRFPDSDALLSYYPSAAQDSEVEGSATLECTVADDKGRVTCIVLAETPKGYGFGRATAKMVQDKGRVDTSQGDVQIGSKLRTTVKWTLN